MITDRESRIRWREQKVVRVFAQRFHLRSHPQSHVIVNIVEPGNRDQIALRIERLRDPVGSRINLQIELHEPLRAIGARA